MLKLLTAPHDSRSAAEQCVLTAPVQSVQCGAECRAQRAAVWRSRLAVARLLPCEHWFMRASSAAPTGRRAQLACQECAPVSVRRCRWNGTGKWRSRTSICTVSPVGSWMARASNRDVSDVRSRHAHKGWGFRVCRARAGLGHTSAYTFGVPPAYEPQMWYLKPRSSK
jgi:hypothetical protein